MSRPCVASNGTGSQKQPEGSEAYPDPAKGSKGDGTALHGTDGQMDDAWQSMKKEEAQRPSMGSTLQGVDLSCWQI